MSTTINATRVASLTAGLISALGIGYQLLAVIWGWPEGDKVLQSSNVLVMIISFGLATLTGKKVLQDGKMVDAPDELPNPFDKLKN